MRLHDNWSATHAVDEAVEEMLDALVWWVGEDPIRQEQMRTALLTYSTALRDMFDVYMFDVYMEDE